MTRVTSVNKSKVWILSSNLVESGKADDEAMHWLPVDASSDLVSCWSAQIISKLVSKFDHVKAGQRFLPTFFKHKPCTFS